MPATTDDVRQPVSLRILLAEDSLFQQKCAVALLQKQGHAVTVASNGQEALDALQDERFDLVLMDIEMPVMDGLQAVTALRHRERQLGRRIPVIAVTTIPDRGQFSAVGMDACLAKPLQVEALNRTMQKLWAQISVQAPGTGAG